MPMENGGPPLTIVREILIETMGLRRISRSNRTGMSSLAMAAFHENSRERHAIFSNSVCRRGLIDAFNQIYCHERRSIWTHWYFAIRSRTHDEIQRRELSSLAVKLMCSRWVRHRLEEISLSPPFPIEQLVFTLFRRSHNAALVRHTCESVTVKAAQICSATPLSFKILNIHDSVGSSIQSKWDDRIHARQMSTYVSTCHTSHRLPDLCHPTKHDCQSNLNKRRKKKKRIKILNIKSDKNACLISICICWIHRQHWLTRLPALRKPPHYMFIVGIDCISMASYYVCMLWAVELH